MKKILFLALLSTSTFADINVLKKEEMTARFEIDGNLQAPFCVKSVNPNAMFEIIGTSTSRRQYICEVDFIGTSQHKQVVGKRVLSYRMTTDVLKRKKIQGQDEKLSSMENRELKKGFYLLPKSVFRLLPNISVESEERKIQDAEYALIPTDMAIDQSAKAACYVGLLETLENACSKKDLEDIRIIVEEKLNKLIERSKN